MRAICAWCFPNASQGEETEEITHGICPFHMQKIRLQTIAYWRKEAEREGQIRKGKGNQEHPYAEKR
jgi:hypothetical protein